MVAPVIGRLTGIARNGENVPGALNAATWCDSRALAANVAENYSVPDGGVMLGITASAGPLYINFNGAAAVITSDVNDGTSSVMLRTDLGAPFIIAAPSAASTLSMICGATCLVSIEVWM